MSDPGDDASATETFSEDKKSIPVKISHFFHQGAKRKRNEHANASRSSSKPESSDFRDEHLQQRQQQQQQQQQQRTKPRKNKEQRTVVIDLIDDDTDDDADNEDGKATSNETSGKMKDAEGSTDSHDSPSVTPRALDNERTDEPALPNVSPPVPLHVPNVKTITAITADLSTATRKEATSSGTSSNDSTINPFEQFAFRGSSPTNSSNTPATLSSWIMPSKNLKGKTPNNTAKISNNNKTTSAGIDSKTSHSGEPTKEAGKKKAKAKTGDWVRMKDFSPEEQAKIVRKWHGLIDETASMEDKRFQVFVAARLHARCQEAQVRKAMIKLRAYFASDPAAIDGNENQQESPPSLSVHSMASADPEALLPAISNLQYHNTKAKQLVKAAQEIRTRYGGKVPKSEHSLKQITGIGPMIADLLAFVNTEAKHLEAATTSAATTTVQE